MFSLYLQEQSFAGLAGRGLLLAGGGREFNNWQTAGSGNKVAA